MQADTFLEYALVFLLAAVVAVPIANRFWLGAVLGFLAAGLAIGPHGLGLVGDPGSTLRVAELGVLFLLFLLGLELTPQRLWAMRRIVFGAGGLQVAVTAAIGAVVLWAVVPGWQTALVLGLALAQSSTAVAMQLLAERRELASAPGQQAFGISLFQDLTAIPTLALLPVLALSAGVAGGDDATPGGTGLLRARGDRRARAGRTRGAAAAVSRDLARGLGRGVLGRGAAGRDRHHVADAARGALGHARRLHRRRAACELGVPARDRIAHPAVQGPAAGPVLHVGRDGDRPLADRAPPTAGRGRRARGAREQDANPVCGRAYGRAPRPRRGADARRADRRRRRVRVRDPDRGASRRPARCRHLRPRAGDRGPRARDGAADGAGDGEARGTRARGGCARLRRTARREPARDPRRLRPGRPDRVAGAGRAGRRVHRARALDRAARLLAPLRQPPVLRRSDPPRAAARRARRSRRGVRGRARRPRAERAHRAHCQAAVPAPRGAGARATASTPSS